MESVTHPHLTSPGCPLDTRRSDPFPGGGSVLLITTDYPPDTGGVAWYYGNLVALRQAQGDKTFVLKLGKWAMTPWWPFMIIPIILRTLKLQLFVRANGRSPLSCHWWVGQVLPVGTVVWLISYVWRKPYIVSTHGMDIMVPLRSPRKRWLVGKILERAGIITVNSEWTKQKIVENYFSSRKSKVESRKFVVIYPEPKPKREVPADEAHALRLKLGIPEGAKVLLSVCRLVKRKGIDRVLAAMPEVWKQVPELHYVIVGDGEERERLEEASILLLKVRGSAVGVMSDEVHNSPSPSYLKRGNESESKVHFAGRVSDEELPASYSMADAFILLPRNIEGDAEGFGIVYCEANQYGLPIIASGTGGSQEALRLCKQVIIIQNPDNPSEIARAIWKLFQ